MSTIVSIKLYKPKSRAKVDVGLSWDSNLTCLPTRMANPWANRLAPMAVAYEMSYTTRLTIYPPLSVLELNYLLYL